jgi:hypothetical protein
MPEILNTPRLARNAPFSHLGAPRGRQSVLLPVHMAKTRHAGSMFGQKMAHNATVVGTTAVGTAVLDGTAVLNLVLEYC